MFASKADLEAAERCVLSWYSLFEGHSNMAAIGDMWLFFEQQYGSKTRHYHNFTHIDQCLGELDKVLTFNRKLIINPYAIELAIWFHDVIYDPRSKYNEWDSAGVASAFIRKISNDAQLHDDVIKYILATKNHDGEHASNDLKYLLDIDMSILGATPDKYDMYVSNVRLEYNHIPEEEFNRGRLAFLMGINLPVFSTEYFKNKYGNNSAINIQSEIVKLMRKSNRDDSLVLKTIYDSEGYPAKFEWSTEEDAASVQRSAVQQELARFGQNISS